MISVYVVTDLQDNSHEIMTLNEVVEGLIAMGYSDEVIFEIAKRIANRKSVELDEGFDIEWGGYQS